MSENDILNDTDLLYTNEHIELVESRIKDLLERKILCKDQAELKIIETQLKEFESELKKLKKTKILLTKAG